MKLVPAALVKLVPEVAPKIICHFHCRLPAAADVCPVGCTAMIYLADAQPRVRSPDHRAPIGPAETTACYPVHANCSRCCTPGGRTIAGSTECSWKANDHCRCGRFRLARLRRPAVKPSHPRASRGTAVAVPCSPWSLVAVPWPFRDALASHSTAGSPRHGRCRRQRMSQTHSHRRLWWRRRRQSTCGAGR